MTNDGRNATQRNGAAAAHQVGEKDGVAAFFLKKNKRNASRHRHQNLPFASLPCWNTKKDGTDHQRNLRSQSQDRQISFAWHYECQFYYSCPFLFGPFFRGRGARHFFSSIYLRGTLCPVLAAQTAPPRNYLEGLTPAKPAQNWVLDRTNADTDVQTTFSSRS